MSNQMPTTDPTLPVELRPTIGKMFTPEEIVEGCDYIVLNVPKPVLLCIGHGVYVYYPAGEHNFPDILDWTYLELNGATCIANTMYLNPFPNGRADTDGWAGIAFGWTLARVLGRIATPPSNPNFAPDPELYSWQLLPAPG